jgi:hypothetical protein
LQLQQQRKPKWLHALHLTQLALLQRQLFQQSQLSRYAQPFWLRLHLQQLQLLN